VSAIGAYDEHTLTRCCEFVRARLMGKMPVGNPGTDPAFQ